MNYTLTIDDSLAAKPEFAGGKGSNLAILTQRGFPVPPCFVVSTQAYKDFISSQGDLMQRVNGFSFTIPARLRTESEELRCDLAKIPLPQQLVSEVHAQLAKFPVAQSFSVRSSSTLEDLAGAAFAGQHETFLNCSTPELILEKIKACFLSLWSDRAIAYRHQKHFDHAQAVMAVVVQQMIDCEVAGVGFSINPVTGDLSEMILNANFGLGESVVSGEGEVDQYIIDKSTRALRSAQIACKSRKVISSSSGIREVHLESEEAGKPCLNKTQLEQLAALLLQVEASYRFPQDIEWGFADETLYLMQSRPVTTIPPRWTRDESAERFPNALTPLTWDFVEHGFHRSLSFSFQLMGFPAYHGKWFEMHNHYIYGNQAIVELYCRRTPFSVRNVEELVAAIPAIRQEFRWVQELPSRWLRDLDQHLIRIGAFQSASLKDKSLREVWKHVLAVNEHGAEYFQPNIAISITHSTLHRLLQRLLAMNFDSETANSLFDRLMAFCETKTGIINKELFELASMVRSQPGLEVLLQQCSSQEVIANHTLQRFPEFNDRFQKFLHDHGHREMDFDAYSPTWIEMPWVVLDNIRLALQSPTTQSPTDKERDLKNRMLEAEIELYQKIPRDLHFFFAELIRLARLYTSLDDLEHYQTTRLTPLLRRGLREMGERLVRQGILSDSMDLFFARIEQISHAIDIDNETGWKEFSTLVRQQKAACLQDKACQPEWILGEKKQKETFEGVVLSGLAGSSGQAEGPVFIVLGPEDFARFPKGAVLVARTTNPTWTPLFYTAAAVITESGGPLSHGAVTAREMRIPAVMSVKQSLTHLKSGQHVRVDGTQGKVWLL
ncbi:PEP/pyruvate-binding domain-containing protein [Pedosphaera parvula]|uniref:Pyruvate phosphate dikinase PEP/pyruvate-binding n=1 Tax=Pedosphaera parvula (strain Ellin514) TaxID=320771 RepID=B9XCQ7_PEDPL|nr:PEP/pyruvate-binding domain-containing protein [Pedosphaera parvula]EEF62253.1 pyruvate phosphate dikinase PEP/pyruvate-binding [Pedosphaera parvula Ellin514]